VNSANNIHGQLDRIYQSMEKLADRIRLIYGAEVDLERFSSTAIMLDIRYSLFLSNAMIFSVQDSFLERLSAFKSNTLGTAKLYQDKFLVIAYSPNYGFGVDKVKEGDEFTTSYSFNADDIRLATQQIYRLIEQE
jgi:hypothetical protein